MNITDEEIEVLLLLLDKVNVEEFKKEFGLSKTLILKKLINKYCNLITLK